MELVDANSVDLLNGNMNMEDNPTLKKMKMDFDFPVDHEYGSTKVNKHGTVEEIQSGSAASIMSLRLKKSSFEFF